jgi:hypothetical protein
MVLLFVTLFLLLAAVFKAAQDKIAHGGGFPRFGQFFVNNSWRNKWKNGYPADGERFWGSSTIFVWLTDGWHLFDFLRDQSRNCAIGVCVYRLCDFYFTPGWLGIVALVVIIVVAQAVFEVIYRKFREK